MIDNAPHQYPILHNFLNRSLFSLFPVSEGFSDKKALQFIDICKEHGVYQLWKHNDINALIGNSLIESIARNVGSGENYGFGFPNDFLEKLEHEIESEIDEGLLNEILSWGSIISLHDYNRLSIQDGDDTEYFYRNKKNGLELISYSTLAAFSYRLIEGNFVSQYNQLKTYLVNKIPEQIWKNLIGGEFNFEELL